MYIRSKLLYNNKKYKEGKAYIAKITGKNETYTFEREFMKRTIRYEEDYTDTIWYSYLWIIEEPGIYELHEENTYKLDRRYFIYDDIEDELKPIKYSEVLDNLKK